LTLVIGITGPIGCGKSTIAGWLAEDGAVVVDADAIARDVTGLGEPVLEAVIDRFGERFRRPDGSLDRAALGRLVFEDPQALADLEAIVHPAVRPRIEAAVTDAKDEGVPIIVVEAIKLVEGGYAAACDEVWLIICDPVAQRERLVARGVSGDEIDRRVSAQGDLASRLIPAASRAIDTSGSRDDVRAVVRSALQAARSGA
jgi:dephospho-CoA kinase